MKLGVDRSLLKKTAETMLRKIIKKANEKPPAQPDQGADAPVSVGEIPVTVGGMPMTRGLLTGGYGYGQGKYSEELGVLQTILGYEPHEQMTMTSFLGGNKQLEKAVTKLIKAQASGENWRGDDDDDDDEDEDGGKK